MLFIVMDKMKNIVLKAIDDLRPYLKNDGGDMEFVEITNDKKVIVRLLGACKTCTASKMTIKAGLEESIKTQLPEIKGVESVNE
tara:strand:- start:448 stop:699 length:252 start_codon:yes stop_codon:yes gene_type:complete